MAVGQNQAKDLTIHPDTTVSGTVSLNVQGQTIPVRLIEGQINREDWKKIPKEFHDKLGQLILSELRRAGEPVREKYGLTESGKIVVDALPINPGLVAAATAIGNKVKTTLLGPQTSTNPSLFSDGSFSVAGVLSDGTPYEVLRGTPYIVRSNGSLMKAEEEHGRAIQQTLNETIADALVKEKDAGVVYMRNEKFIAVNAMRIFSQVFRTKHAEDPNADLQQIVEVTRGTNECMPLYAANPRLMEQIERIVMGRMNVVKGIQAVPGHAVNAVKKGVKMSALGAVGAAALGWRAGPGLYWKHQLAPAGRFIRDSVPFSWTLAGKARDLDQEHHLLTQYIEASSKGNCREERAKLTEKLEEAGHSRELLEVLEEISAAPHYAEFRKERLKRFVYRASLDRLIKTLRKKGMSEDKIEKVVEKDINNKLAGEKLSKTEKAALVDAAFEVTDSFKESFLRAISDENITWAGKKALGITGLTVGPTLGATAVLGGTAFKAAHLGARVAWAEFKGLYQTIPGLMNILKKGHRMDGVKAIFKIPLGILGAPLAAWNAKDIFHVDFKIGGGDHHPHPPAKAGGGGDHAGGHGHVDYNSWGSVLKGYWDAVAHASHDVGHVFHDISHAWGHWSHEKTDPDSKVGELAKSIMGILGTQPLLAQKVIDGCASVIGKSKSWGFPKKKMEAGTPVEVQYSKFGEQLKDVDFKRKHRLPFLRAWKKEPFQKEFGILTEASEFKAAMKSGDGKSYIKAQLVKLLGIPPYEALTVERVDECIALFETKLGGEWDYYEEPFNEVAGKHAALFGALKKVKGHLMETNGKGTNLTVLYPDAKPAAPERGNVGDWLKKFGNQTEFVAFVKEFKMLNMARFYPKMTMALNGAHIKEEDKEPLKAELLGLFGAPIENQAYLHGLVSPMVRQLVELGELCERAFGNPEAVLIGRNASEMAHFLKVIFTAFDQNFFDFLYGRASSGSPSGGVSLKKIEEDDS